MSSRPGQMVMAPEEQALLDVWDAMDSRFGESGSLAELVHETISNAIIERVLPPGWRLSEERLASLFAVSRTPVREALAGLARSNLATRDKRGKLCVSEVTPQQILNVYRVREALEALSAALAAECATPRALEGLRNLNDAFEAAAAAGDFDACASANIEFHAAIAASSENELLMEFIDDIHAWVKRFPTSTLAAPGRAMAAAAEHEGLIAAIEARDRVRAEELARAHMQLAEEIRVRMFRENQTRPRDSRR